MVRTNPLTAFLFLSFRVVLLSATTASGADYSNSEQSSAIEDMFRPLPGTEGKVDDARCDVESVEVANAQQLHALLDDVMKTRFFSLFKVNLKRECKFWGADGGGECAGDDAAVAEEKSPFGGSGGVMGGMSSSTEEPTVPSCALSTEGSIPWGALTDEIASGVAPTPTPASSTDDCHLPSFWLDMCTDIPTDNAQFVDLQTNPERYTGFNGSKIWEAIYRENCFSRANAVDSMCYEERVLYRLISAMHSSINIHVALNWHPPRKGKRDTFAPNTARFASLFKDHPDRLKNVHFAFVVLLRAIQKAGPHLMKFDTSVNDLTEDFRTKKLLGRLLDSDILHSCSGVFEAFDETLMFGPSGGTEPELGLDSIKHSFKGVFQNISRVLDCVTCQTCKLHGKMQLLGMGTALKILLLPDEMVGAALSRDEVVALINTVGKFSHAITGARKLFNLDFDRYLDGPVTAKPNQLPLVVDVNLANTLAANKKAQPPPPPLPPSPAPMVPLQEDELADLAIGLVARLEEAGLLTPAQEEALITRVLAGDKTLLMLAKHYQHNLKKFVRFATTIPVGSGGSGSDVVVEVAAPVVDAVVVGAGLAGLTAALTLADRGGTVILIDKNKFTGGNSAYASSGINAFDPDDVAPTGDSFNTFYSDVAGGHSNISANGEALVEALTRGSHLALTWLRERVGLDLPLKSQLGGHSWARTWRPSSGMAGSEMVFATTKIAKQLEKANGQTFATKFGTKMKELVVGDDGAVVGVRVERTDAAGSVVEETITAASVVLATGGYASDDAGPTSLLSKYRPDVASFGTTNGAFATGDGIKAALNVGALGVNLHDVQVHPTAFFDHKHPTQARRTLAAELLRGLGGIMLSINGTRFADELGKRSYVTAQMMQIQPEKPHFTLMLSEKMAVKADKHVPHYLKKGLLTKLDSLADVAGWMKVALPVLLATLDQYHTDAAAGVDVYGKTVFNEPLFDESTAPFYVGTVLPARHYTMGGLGIDPAGRVLKEDGSLFAGLFAAGEITGGVHGENRLGGNALTEAVVFGQLVGQAIPLHADINADGDGSAGAGAGANDAVSGGGVEAGGAAELRTITVGELGAHNTEADCWVAVYGKVYDFSDFLAEHPGGIETITEFAGADGTETFDSIHSKAMLDDFDALGVMAPAAE